MVNRRACPDLESTQIIVSSRLALLSQGLSGVRAASDVCLVTCVTNFLTSASGSSSASIRIEPVVADFREKIVDACQTFPERLYLVYPPMYRSSPLWFRDELPEVLKKFSIMMSEDRPKNLILMSGFSSPSFEADGVHLTPYSGLEYLLFLFDSAREAIRLDGLDLADRASVGNEATRVLEDRMMAIEQDHRRLNRAFELKTAIDSEREDFQENVRNEIFFMITGLAPIQGLRGKDWMTKAIADVQGSSSSSLVKSSQSKLCTTLPAADKMFDTVSGCHALLTLKRSGASSANSSQVAKIRGPILFALSPSATRLPQGLRSEL